MAFDPASDNAMLVAGEVSSALTYHPTGAADVSIRGVFAPTPAFESMDERGRSHVREGTLYILNVATTGRTSIDSKDEVTINGARYAIVAYHDDFGVWVLTVRLTQRRERAGGPFMQSRV